MLFRKYPEIFKPLDHIDTVWEWLQKTTYNGSRCQQLLEAASRFVDFGFVYNSQAFKVFSKVKSFIKVEDYIGWKFARWINSRVDEFKAYWGPACKQIEERVYQLKYFIKHVPVALRPDSISGLISGGLKYWQTDYSAFESLIRQEVMDNIELELYRHMLSNFPEYAATVCRVLRGQNVLKTSFWKVKILARRMSGDMNTSLGNGFTNLVLWMTMCRLCGIPEDQFDGYVEGDDGIFATPDLPIWSEDQWKKAGFLLKLRSVEDPSLASFCGIVTAGGCVMRNPWKFIVSFGWTSSMIGHGRDVGMSLLKAKALSALYETPQCPIVAAIAHYALRHCGTVAPRFIEDGYRSVLPDGWKPPSEFAPSMEVRSIFAQLYGISIPTQLACERSIAKGDLSCLSSLLHALPGGEDTDACGYDYVASAWMWDSLSVCEIVTGASHCRTR